MPVKGKQRQWQTVSTYMPSAPCSNYGPYHIAVVTTGIGHTKDRDRSYPGHEGLGGHMRGLEGWSGDGHTSAVLEVHLKAVICGEPHCLPIKGTGSTIDDRVESGH